MFPGEKRNYRKSGLKAPVIHAGDEEPFLNLGVGWNILAKSVVFWDTSNMEYHHDNHYVHLIVYHIIFCPKRRRKILVGPIRDRLQQILQEVATEHQWSIIEKVY